MIAGAGSSHILLHTRVVISQTKGFDRLHIEIGSHETVSMVTSTDKIMDHQSPIIETAESMEAKAPDATAIAAAVDDVQQQNGAELIGKLQMCLLMASLFCGTFVMALDSTIIGTAVPSITTEFGALDDIAWYGSGYLLTITAFQPLFGKLYRYFNIKVVFMACILTFEGKLLSKPMSYTPR